MVDVSLQNNSVSINVSSSGNSASIKATPDTALFYSEKSREWAISNRIVDNEDYSSKYYAEQSKASAQVASNVKTETQELVDGFDNKVQIAKDEALTNIETSKAEAIERLKQSSTALTQSQITNCLLEVPQNIKLELNDGVLTLKAGSKVIVPNGKDSNGNNVFNEVVIDNDLTLNPTSLSTNTRAIFIKPTKKTIHLGVLSYCKSGTTPEQGYYYHTGENKMYVDTVLAEGLSFPLMYGEWVKDAGYSSIDQVFNGMGYIGSTIWVDKGVKVLIPTGRNEDGSLKNIEYVKPSVSTTQVTEKNRQVAVFMSNTGIVSKWGSDNRNVTQYKTRPAIPEKTYVKAYIEDENVWWYADNTAQWITKQYIVPIFYVYTDANAIIQSASFNQPFRAVDYSDKSEVSSWSMPSNRYIGLTLGANDSTYTAPANGYYVIWSQSSAVGQHIDLYNTTTYLRLQCASVTSGQYVIGNIEVKKGDVVKINYKVPNTTTVFRFIYAQGEV